MRRCFVPFIAGLWLLTVLTPGASAASTSVRVRAAVGFSNLYRVGPQWVPVTAQVTNTGASLLTGYLAVRGNVEASSTFTQPVVLYPGTTKNVTVYIPATGVGNAVTIDYMSGAHMLGEAVSYPQPVPDSQLLIGALTDNPSAAAWLRTAAPVGPRVHVVTLSASTMPTAPEALAGLDAVVLTNVDSSRLDSDQIAGLRSYVEAGGSLLVVGGPGWQATLGGLPHDLLPGYPAGLSTIPRLPDPTFLGRIGRPGGRVGVAGLASSNGAVLLATRNLGLVVKKPTGNGLVEYLAFDPSLTPLTRWSGSGRFAAALVDNAVPQSMRRLTLDPADRSTSFLFPGSQPMGLGAELANVPTPALALFLGVLAFAVVALMLVIAITLAIRQARPALAPFVIPLALLLAIGGLVETTPAFARSRTIVNTLSFVRLQGNGPTYPATVYAGLIAPVSGTYRVEYPHPALATNISSLYPGPYWDGGTTVSEGAATEADLGHVGMWSARAVALRTAVSLQGHVSTNLRLTATGTITGTVRNGTNLVLHEPVLIAGRAFVRLGDMPPHSSSHVSLVPSADPQEHDYIPMLTRIYGRPFNVGNGIPAVSPFGNPSNMPAERTLSDRIRDAVDTLPETNLVSVLGEVTFVAWTDAPLAPLTVNGSSVQQRNLAVIVEGVPRLTFPTGRFHLRTGTVGAEMVSVVPAPAPYPCCGVTAEPISFGPGGSAVFEFSLSRHLHISELRLHLYAGGSDPSASGYEGVPAHAVRAYDWHTGSWKPLAFRNGTASPASPGRFLSPSGTLLVQVTARSGDLSILDPHQDLQIQATGTHQ